MAKGKDLVGRGTRGQNAMGTIAPYAERQDDGSWATIADPRSLFPPDGLVEIRGVLASGMRDGDRFVFVAAPNDRHRGSTKFKAMSARKAARFLDLPNGETPEGRRRAVVEIGLDEGSAGEWVIRIGDSEMVRVVLQQGRDGRWRADGKELPRLPVRTFEEGSVIVAETDGDALLYDPDRSAQTGRSVNWMSDADYLRTVSAALTDGGRQDAGFALEALASRSAPDQGGVSVAGGADPEVLDDVIRAGALAKLLKTDTTALGGFLKALAAQPEVKEALRKLAEEKAEERLPELEATVKARIEAEFEAERAARLEQVRAAISELETSELAELDRKRNDALAEIEDSSNEARSKARQAEETEAEEARTRHAATLGAFNAKETEAEAAIEALDGRRAELAGSVRDLEAREDDLRGRLVELARDREDLSRRNRAAMGHPLFDPMQSSVGVALDEIETVARGSGVLSTGGIDAVTRLAILLVAGEVPIIRGAGASDFVEFAASILAGGRMARLHGDPTLVTYDDLWSRAGAGSSTAFGAAAAWSQETGRPLLAHVASADRSAARFWYPALVDVRRRDLLPAHLMICLTLDDERSDEAEALPKDIPWVDSENAFELDSLALLPSALLAFKAAGRELAGSSPVVDQAADVVLLSKHKGLSLAAAVRTSHVHAAARYALGSERGFAMANEFALALPSDVPTASGSPSFLSLAANA